MRHGTQYAYARRKCRCGTCKAWKADKNRQDKEVAISRGLTHGTATAYRYGCRCDPCRDAKRAEMGRRTPETTVDYGPRSPAGEGKSNRERQLKSKYGLTLTDYDRMVSEKGGVCWICGRVGKRQLVVDHCHRTGKVRKLLCDGCNTSLGVLKEDTRIMQRMIDYVNEHNVI